MRIRRPAPGGFAWLVRHELRLALRGTGARRRWFARVAPLLLLAAIPTVGGVILAIALRHDSPSSADLRSVLGFIGAGIIALLVLMISTAALAVLRTFHDRGDLDLLLAAPIPPARVLAAKSVGVAVSVAAPFLALIAPFAVTSAVLGTPRWLGAVAIVGVDATLATAIAIALAGVLFRTLGARRARVAVQLGAAVAGGAVFLLSQSPNLAPRFAHRLFAAAGRPWPPPLDWPARAAIGEPLPLVAMAALAGAAAWVAARFGARQLMRAGDAQRGGVAAHTTTVTFRTGVTRIVVAKELRLIARDPELIAQIGLRLIYLIPMAALVLRGRHGVDPGPAIAAGATAFAGLLASSLAWIVVAAEDAPDLLAAAPRPAADIARAKLVAACAVPIGVVILAALAAARINTGAAAVTLGLGSLAAITAALLQAWFGKPAPRAAFRRRQQSSFVIGVGEIVLAAAWAGTANLLVRGSVWALVPALTVGLIMAGAIEAHAARKPVPSRAPA